MNTSLTPTTAATTQTTSAAGFRNGDPCIGKWMRSSEFRPCFTINPKQNGSSGPGWKYRQSTLLVFARSPSSPEIGKEKKNKRKKKKKDDDDTYVKEEDKAETENKLVEAPFSSSSDLNSNSVIKRLDEVNPVGLGRRSRQIFDEVWHKFSELGQISRTSRTIDETSRLLIREGGPMCEFAIPGTQNTTILAVGATSRVGRIIVRKLMLRGYTVKLSSVLSDIGLNIHEAHVFSTTDGYSLDVFVVDGWWPVEDTDGLQEAVKKAIARGGRTWSGASHSQSAIEKALAVTEISGDWEIDIRLIKMNRIAYGSSGYLYRGVYRAQDVAVKVLRSMELNNDTEKEFMNEFAVLRLDLTPLKAAIGVAIQGLRRETPANMHPKLLNLMQRCWEHTPSNRPSFTDIRIELEEFLLQL